MLITYDMLPTWLRESGEIAYSQPGGAGMRVDVHDSAVSLTLLWNRQSRPTLELFIPISPILEEDKLDWAAERVLENNRDAWRTGAWLHMAGDVGVSARAPVFLVNDQASDESLDRGIDAVRNVMAKYEAEFDKPIDPTHVHRRRSQQVDADSKAHAKLVEKISSSPPTAHAIEAKYEGGLLQLVSRAVPPMSSRAAASAAGLSTATALHRDADGALVMTTTAFLESDAARSEQIVLLAWQCMGFDLDWIKTAAR